MTSPRSIVRRSLLGLSLTLLAVGWACGSTTATPPSPTVSPSDTPTPTVPKARSLYATDDLPPEVLSEARAWAKGHGLLYAAGPAAELTPTWIADGLAYVVSLHEAEWASAPAFVEAGVRGVAVDPLVADPSHVVSGVVADQGTWEEAGFLAGLLTGLIGHGRAGGWVATGEDSEEASALAAGFDQGMRYACPRCVVVRQEAASLDAAEFVRQGVEGVFVAPGEGAAGVAVAAADAGLWIVWIGEAPPGLSADHLAATLHLDPAPLLSVALDALAASGEGRTWPYSVGSNSLVVAGVDAKAISPGKQRLLEQALGKLASDELQLMAP